MLDNACVLLVINKLVVCSLSILPPKKKKMSIRLFVEFVALLTKIWPKILFFTFTAKFWREGCYAPPPAHQDVIDVI